jgi:hypothetical protein
MTAFCKLGKAVVGGGRYDDDDDSDDGYDDGYDDADSLYTPHDVFIRDPDLKDAYVHLISEVESSGALLSRFMRVLEEGIANDAEAVEGDALSRAMQQSALEEQEEDARALEAGVSAMRHINELVGDIVQGFSDTSDLEQEGPWRVLRHWYVPDDDDQAVDVADHHYYAVAEYLELNRSVHDDVLVEWCQQNGLLSGTQAALLRIKAPGLDTLGREERQFQEGVNAEGVRRAHPSAMYGAQLYQRANPDRPRDSTPAYWR